MAGGRNEDAVSTFTSISTELFDPSINSWRLIDEKLPGSKSGLRMITTFYNNVFIFGINLNWSHHLISWKCWSSFLGGGWVNDWEGKNYLVLKFDIEKEEYYEYGRMIYGRKFHAISLVPLSDYSNWCTTYAK